ncbi:hypothetical protein BCD67_25245 [Oscillatoriales cyanobacterium USR001]|nr:hypothetical protein BCD67_25245 [Oscillatoriales cyanobacterium USR001]
MYFINPQSDVKAKQSIQSKSTKQETTMLKFVKLLVCSIFIFFLVTYASTSMAKENKIVAESDILVPSQVYNLDNTQSVELMTKEPIEVSQQGTNIKEVVRPFYTKCLTVNPNTNVAEVMGKILANDFKSFGSADVKGKEQLIKQVQFFWKLIPDLKWEIQEMLQHENRVIVRSIASGTPKGEFMGLPTDGTKSFKIMTIDIHTVKNGQVVEVYHVEDWATAMRQLKK